LNKNNQFISKCKKVNTIIDALNLTKGLLVSSLIVGEAYSGRLSMIRFLYPNWQYVDGLNTKEVSKMLKLYNKLIIFNFDKLDTSDIFLNDYFNNVCIIAIANYKNISKTPKNIKKYFAFIYEMPPLSARNEDSKYFKNKFVDKITKEIKDTNNINNSNGDNLKQLELLVYKQIILKNLSLDELKETISCYFNKNLGVENSTTYKEYMHFYENILLKAGLKKFGSKMKLSQALKLTRNTIRAKLNNTHKV
jgi:hypothetical protein